VNPFLADSYAALLEASLKGNARLRPRGALKQLAEKLRVHPSFISQVLLGKSHLSVDQALLAAEFFGFGADETDHFLDLLHRDRSATPAARAYFDRRIEKRNNDRLNLKRRFQEQRQLTPDQESVYYEDWATQAIHMLCQLPGKHTTASIAKVLKLDGARAEAKVKALQAAGFLSAENGSLRTRLESFHLGKDSRVLPRLHSNWRLKTLHEIASGLGPDSVHYTSVMTITEKAARKIRDAILEHLEETRAEIAAAETRALYHYSLDFFPLVRE
jgi:transcriptional regulator with XRE-family HTH domain